MPRQDEIEFTAIQEGLLHQIHELAREMEHIKNTGKVHAVIALIEELSNEYIDIVYFIEKANLLFMEEEYKINVEVTKNE